MADDSLRGTETGYSPMHPHEPELLPQRDAEGRYLVCGLLAERESEGATMPREREFEWKPGRFKDVVLYVAGELADDPTFGSTKLNKILYFADTEAYKRLGQPITGAVYQRNHHGPTASEYPPMIREMVSEGYITVGRERIVDHEQERVRTTHQVLPNMDQFSADERAILDEVLAEFRGYTNTRASDESHKRSAGWLARDQGETIPYIDSLINPEPLDDALVAGLKTKVPV